MKVYKSEKAKKRIHDTYNRLLDMWGVDKEEQDIPTAYGTTHAILCGKNSGVFTDNQTVMEHYQALLKGFNNMAMRHHKLEQFSDEEAAAIRGKTLYLIGDADPFARLGGKELLLRYKMNARFFPDAGHGINHEIADEINQVLIGMLSA